MITVQFSFASPISAAQRRQLTALLDDVQLLNRRNNRFFVEAVDRRDDLQSALNLLTQWGKEPRVIGVWRQDGSRHPQFQTINVAEFIEVAPDVDDGNGNPVRPVAFVQVHKFLGWSDKQ